MKRNILVTIILLLACLTNTPLVGVNERVTHAQARTVRFAVIGDFGLSNEAERNVAKLVKRWRPELIITLGDNNYPEGAVSSIDQNIGQYYHEYIFPYTGSFGKGAFTNKFFPALGNHDWVAPGAEPYLNYFTLPGNERYYDFVKGPVHFFAIDSDGHEPDGISSDSVQASWLRDKLATSTAKWKIVYFHHPPYSSGTVHGSTGVLQWPFQAWGASAVLAGHEHNYERIIIDGFPYFVNGLGGNINRYPFATVPIAGSAVRFNSDFGAQLVIATTTSITFRFYTQRGKLIDTYVLRPQRK
jgi:tartrate-resistant acid phosphatase type 5